MAKRLLKRAAAASRVLSLASRCRPPSVTVLRYHSIQDDRDQLAHIIGRGIIHSTDVFAKQMETLAKRFNPVTIDDVLAFARGEMELRKRSVAVTFDDGYADNCRIAAPIMERYGIRGAIYVTVKPIVNRSLPWFCRLKGAFAAARRTSWHDQQSGVTYSLQIPEERMAAFRRAAELCATSTGQKQLETVAQVEQQLEAAVRVAGNDVMLSVSEMQRLSKAGHVIGSHTLTHPNLAQISRDELEHELGEAKSRLEELLGSEVKHFSYPAPILEPHWNGETVEACLKAGYATAVTCTRGVVSRDGCPLTICRIPVPHDLDEFIWTIEANICWSA